MARISAKNQITLPVAVLERLGLRAGDDVEIRAVGDHVEVAAREHPLRGLAGAMPAGTWPRRAASELRREWDR